MTTLREVVDSPGMPAWVRAVLLLMSAVMLRLAAAWGEPMIHGGWTAGHGLATVVACGVGLDLLHGAVRKRWPLVLFADLLVTFATERRR